MQDLAQEGRGREGRCASNVKAKSTLMHVGGRATHHNDEKLGLVADARVIKSSERGFRPFYWSPEVPSAQIRKEHREKYTYQHIGPCSSTIIATDFGIERPHLNIFTNQSGQAALVQHRVENPW